MVGRGTFGGWDDADPVLACAVWCLAAHLRPRRAVETGVARGLTTRFILERLMRQPDGRLWSIDIPPLIERGLAGETGAAVPASCRSRWTYVRGSSRVRLPGLLRRLGRIELFVHDSMHTERNMTFELETAWASLSPGGAIVVDDVHRNAAFAAFLESIGEEAESVVAASSDRAGQVGIVLRRGRARDGGSPPRTAPP
jgi:hypothetical protein